ncbi:unknown [Prevotella sp. CAG:1124]|nr:unknown [Prevotella sp. CAG:1124]
MVCLGALSLIIGYPLGWTDHNAMLLSAAGMIIAGVVAHVYFLKKDSKY